ncbi:MAG: hypothetical protein U1F77_11920 [Kiritimatiellia bacterium]
MSPSTSAPGGRRTILYVGGFELPDRNAAAQRVLAVGRLFRELGYGSAFLGVDRKLRHGTRSSPRSAWRVGFQRGRLPIRRGAGLDHHLSKADAALELIRHLQADLAAVVAYNYPALALSVIQGACRRMGIPVVADATEWYSSDGGSPSSPAQMGGHHGPHAVGSPALRRGDRHQPLSPPLLRDAHPSRGRDPHPV